MEENVLNKWRLTFASTALVAIVSTAGFLAWPRSSSLVDPPPSAPAAVVEPVTLLPLQPPRVKRSTSQREDARPRKKKRERAREQPRQKAQPKKAVVRKPADVDIRWGNNGP